MERDRTEKAEDFARISEGYDHFWGSVANQVDNWADKPRTLRSRALKLIPGSVHNILDLGCGNGEALRALGGRGFSLVGIDISIKGLQKAKQSGEVLRADITKMPIREGFFECVLVLDVFEHVVDKNQFMKEVHRILRDDGLVIMTIPLPWPTAGMGDERQPYDKPIEFDEFLKMISGRFIVDRLVGYSWLPAPRIVETYVPLSVGFSLFKSFPFLIERSETILVFLRKAK